jgi:hypothetical protein
LEDSLIAAIQKLKTDSKLFHAMNGNLTDGSEGLKRRRSLLIRMEEDLSRSIDDSIISKIEREEYHMNNN